MEQQKLAQMSVTSAANGFNLDGISRQQRLALTEALTPKLSGFCPHYPTPKQAAFLLLDCKEAFFGGAAGGGKACLVSTPVRTPEGWKQLYEIHPGDIVYTEQGEETQVLAESEIMWDKPCYKVVLDDGTEIITANDHRWTITTHVDAQRNNCRLRVMTTEEMYTSGLLIYNKTNVSGQKLYISKYRIPVAKPLKGREQKLLVHPYLLGYWLGDGSRADSSISTMDEEVALRISSLGYDITKVKGENYQWYVKGIRGALNSLQLLGAAQSKHIPEIYLQASFEQRLELLRGLMDSDGTVEDRGVTCFCNTEESLVKDVSFLLRSLGYKHGVSHVKPSLGYKHGASNYSANLYEMEYRLTFTPMPEFPVFYLPRKKARLKTERNSRNDWYFIKSIEPFAKVPVKCIQVASPTHLFLIGKELIPTHNSDALLMAALQYVDIPGYSAVLFRRTYSDLTLPGALMDRMAQWLAKSIEEGTVRWIDKLKTYIFQCPNGGTSTITFGYLEHDGDKYRYQGAEFQFIGFDEVTQLLESCYRYLFSRLRRLKNVKIPLRVRGASNPGGTGHEWVKRRFITEGKAKGRIFIPAKMEDNPFLDTEEYEQSLMELDPITRAQLRSGNWDVKTEGSIFHREWFDIIERSEVPWDARRVRFWDMAATEVSKANKDPDWTVGCHLAESKGFYYILDIRRMRRRPSEVEDAITWLAAHDGYETAIRMEQEPGSEGLHLVDHYARTVLLGYDFQGVKSTGSKATRAAPVSSAAEQRRIKVIRAAWNSDFFDELEAFPYVDHDDQTDSLSGAFAQLRQAVNPLALPLEFETDSYWDEDAM